MLALQHVVAPGLHPLYIDGCIESWLEGGVVFHRYHQRGLAPLENSASGPAPIASYHRFDNGRYQAFIDECGALHVAGDNRDGALCVPERVQYPMPVTVDVSAPVRDVTLSRYGSRLSTTTDMEYWFRGSEKTVAPLDSKQYLHATCPPRAGWFVGLDADRRHLGVMVNGLLQEYILASKVRTLLAPAASTRFFVAVTVDGLLYYPSSEKRTPTDMELTGIGGVAPPPSLILATARLPGPVRLVACGRAHTLVLLDDGSVYAHGDNDRAQLGTGDLWPRDYFVRVRLPQRVSALWAVGNASFFRLADGTIYGAGSLFGAPLVGGYHPMVVDDDHLPEGLRRRVVSGER